ncbi:nucleotidyltransferase family protein [Alkaliphilus hydrothermalis]|uniref:Nucleotidyl transferase AbiEii toxin, Type IV TA system n=1 Tax=Alkaliphilus hydrothermalis TaxID=1482730 RepID=A0ABS2NSE8_9FIRM|nr:hypothetical protein [Alkaliphilus hydrothermalis]MBM7615884.1 hypothetical protein [Alkaliphilus hydrothermalis]
MNFDTLAYVAEKINNQNIRWGLGGSLVLHHYGLIDDPNDMDILVSLGDAEALDDVLQSIGERKEKEATLTYKTKFFNQYKVKTMDIDVMGGFTIKHSRGDYEFPFDEESIIGCMERKGVKIPLTSLEDWYIVYQLLPNREEKVKLIEEYFIKHGIKHHQLIERALQMCLPPEVISRTKELLAEVG